MNDESLNNNLEYYSDFKEMKDAGETESLESNKRINLLKKKKEKIELLDWLYKSSQEPPEIRKYIQGLESIANLKNHSMFNRFLILKQRPGAKYVLDPKQWAEKHERRPKPNAIPIIYFINYGPYKYVYDYSDTIGDKSINTNLFSVKQKEAIVDAMTISQLVTTLENRFRIQVKYVDLGITNFGNVARIKMYSSKKNIKAFLGDELVDFSIHVAKHLSPPEQLAVICHELAHIYCGHIGEVSREYENKNGEKQKEIIFEGRADLGKGTEEFEADAVSFLILSSFDLYPNSDEYIKGYLSKQKIKQMEKERFSDYYIMEATKRIELIIKSLGINYHTLKRKKQIKQIQNFKDRVFTLIIKFIHSILNLFRLGLIKVLEYLIKALEYLLEYLLKLLKKPLEYLLKLLKKP